MIIIPEKDPNVFQASGYADLSLSKHMWSVYLHLDRTAHDARGRFWFFAARENPNTAPLAIWINGGVSFIIFTYSNKEYKLGKCTLAWQFVYVSVIFW